MISGVAQAMLVLAVAGLVSGCTVFADTDVKVLLPPPEQATVNVPGACGPDEVNVGAACTTDADCGCGSCSPNGCAESGFAYIPAGTFTMGASAEVQGTQASVRPAHEVTISRDYVITAVEVTNALWEELYGDSATELPSLGTICHSQCLPRGTTGCCPLTGLNWYEIVAIANDLSTAEGLEECYVIDDSKCTGTVGSSCRSEETEDSVNPETEQALPVCDRTSAADVITLGDVKLEPIPVRICDADAISFAGVDCAGYRLPTEAEWEYAATVAGSTGSDHTYLVDQPFGDVAQTSDTSAYTDPGSLGGLYLPEGVLGLAPRPVAGLYPNDFGLYDVLGNVRELTHDSEQAYTAGAQTDPADTGTLSSTSFIARGCSASDPSDTCSVRARLSIEASRRNMFDGFRLVRTVTTSGD